MKFGRNDPCPCGSGKKYKKCCLEKIKVSDLGYNRLSTIQNELVKKLTEYVARDLGQRVISVALSDFFLYDDSDESDLWEIMTEEFSTVFWPWLFYVFELDMPDIDEYELFGLMQPNMTVAEMFMQDKGSQLEPLELELLSACNRVPFSFFEVEGIQLGQGFQAVNLLTGQRHKVYDISASEVLKRGDIIFTLITEIREYAMSIGNAQYKFYPRFKPKILDFRKELEHDYGSLTNQEVIDVEFELRELFLALHDALFEPPELRNTDGEPLSFRTLHYEIASPEEALEALTPLCLTQTKDALKDKATLDANKRVHKVQFVWNREGHAISKGINNTSLGRITIQGNKMTVEVNSSAREEKIKQKIAKRLGNRATYKVTHIRSFESILADTDLDSVSSKFDEEEKALQNSPEVQEAVKNILKKHWEGWLDSEIPALGGKTPRQAVQTADGRESVQALLRDLESHDENSVMPVAQQPYIDWARSELGLSD